jgi:hypothetical protein
MSGVSATVFAIAAKLAKSKDVFDVQEGVVSEMLKSELNFTLF